MGTTRRVILILENDVATCELYRRELSRTYRVLACCDEEEARRCLTSEPIDVIILEPMALVDESWQFAVHMRRSERYSRTPIIVCSSLDDRRHGGEIGAAAYLIKPVAPAALAAAVAAALAATAADSIHT